MEHNVVYIVKIQSKAYGKIQTYIYVIILLEMFSWEFVYGGVCKNYYGCLAAMQCYLRIVYEYLALIFMWNNEFKIL